MESYFSIDTLLQGITMVFCTILGCLVFFTDHLEEKGKSSSLGELNTQIGATFLGALQLIGGLKAMEGVSGGFDKVSKTITYSIMFAILAFVAGIFASTSGDVWMNSNNAAHLGNKVTWADTLIQGEKSSDIIRYDSFEKVLAQDIKNVKNVSDDSKNKFYYFAKHEILANKEYAPYLDESTELGEYSQAFALSFFILYIFAWLNLISLQIRFLLMGYGNSDDNSTKFKEPFSYTTLIYRILLGACFGVILVRLIGKYFPGVPRDLFGNPSIVYCIAVNAIPILIWLHLWYKSKSKYGDQKIFGNETVTYKVLFIKHYYTIIFLWIGFVGYFVSGITWWEAESDKHKKVYGLYKNVNEDIKNYYLDFTKDMIVPTEYSDKQE